jgi:hypothetical protein
MGVPLVKASARTKMQRGSVGHDGNSGRTFDFSADAALAEAVNPNAGPPP